jgi:hypothetical protein
VLFSLLKSSNWQFVEGKILNVSRSKIRLQAKKPLLRFDVNPNGLGILVVLKVQKLLNCSTYAKGYGLGLVDVCGEIQPK